MQESRLDAVATTMALTLKACNAVHGRHLEREHCCYVIDGLLRLPQVRLLRDSVVAWHR